MGSCGHGNNEHPSSIEDGECIFQLNDYQLLNKDPVPWSWLIAACDETEELKGVL